MLHFDKLTATHYALRHHSDDNLHIKHIYTANQVMTIWKNVLLDHLGCSQCCHNMSCEISMHKVFNELVQIFHKLQRISGFQRFEK